MQDAQENLVCADPDCTTVLLRENIPIGFCFTHQSGTEYTTTTDDSIVTKTRSGRTCENDCGTILATATKGNVCLTCIKSAQAIAREEKAREKNFYTHIKSQQPTKETPTSKVVTRIVTTAYRISPSDVIGGAGGRLKIRWARHLLIYFLLELGFSRYQIRGDLLITLGIVDHATKAVARKTQENEEIAQTVETIRQLFLHI